MSHETDRTEMPTGSDVVATGQYLDEFARPGAIALTATVALAMSYLVAIKRPVPGWELRLTDWINGAPDTLASVLYPVMQLGTLGGPLVTATTILIFSRDLVLSSAVVLTGLVTWFAAPGHQTARRTRSAPHLPAGHHRPGDGTGLGFISGHSAVAASAAIMAMVAIPRRWRPLAGVAVATVGIARIVHGVHLAADVVGGIRPE